MTVPLVPYVPHFSPLPRLTAVRREEVFIRRFFELVTMPADTYRRIETATGSKLVGDPGLWQPLLDALAAQIDPYGPGRPWLQVPKPEFWPSQAIEAVCSQCGIRYLGLHRMQRYFPVCSNNCAQLLENEKQRARRRANPPDYTKVNAARTERRAAGRAGLVCEHCGQSFEAARSTRRFCSDICRVRWHRAKPQAAQ
jgi:endogenous inhibitor of DNA gyrase (YacG/DUF329 family)